MYFSHDRDDGLKRLTRCVDSGKAMRHVEIKSIDRRRPFLPARVCKRTMRVDEIGPESVREREMHRQAKSGAFVFESRTLNRWEHTKTFHQSLNMLHALGHGYVYVLTVLANAALCIRALFERRVGRGGPVIRNTEDGDVRAMHCLVYAELER